NLGENRLGKLTRLLAANRSDLDDVLLVDRLSQRAAILFFDLFGLVHRTPQAHGDIRGNMVSTQSDNSRMPDCIVLEDRYFACPPADVYQSDAKMLFVRIQYSAA